MIRLSARLQDMLRDESNEDDFWPHNSSKRRIYIVLLVYLKDSNAASHFVNSLILFAQTLLDLLWTNANPTF